MKWGAGWVATGGSAALSGLAFPFCADRGFRFAPPPAAFFRRFAALKCVKAKGARLGAYWGRGRPARDANGERLVSAGHVFCPVFRHCPRAGRPRPQSWASKGAVLREVLLGWTELRLARGKRPHLRKAVRRPVGKTGGGRAFFQWLEKGTRIFPTIGKNGADFSNGWKKRGWFFQWLENGGARRLFVFPGF